MPRGAVVTAARAVRPAGRFRSKRRSTAGCARPAPARSPPASNRATICRRRSPASCARVTMGRACSSIGHRVSATSIVRRGTTGCPPRVSSSRASACSTRAARSSRCRTTARPPSSCCSRTDDAPIEVVVNPPAFPGDAEYDGLDARDAFPPFLRPGVLMDWDTLAAWDRFTFARLEPRNPQRRRRAARPSPRLRSSPRVDAVRRPTRRPSRNPSGGGNSGILAIPPGI